MQEGGRRPARAGSTESCGHLLAVPSVASLCLACATRRRRRDGTVPWRQSVLCPGVGQDCGQNLCVCGSMEAHPLVAPIGNSSVPLSRRFEKVLQASTPLSSTPRLRIGQNQSRECLACVETPHLAPILGKIVKVLNWTTMDSMR